jgi:hypothetical protein
MKLKVSAAITITVATLLGGCIAAQLGNNGDIDAQTTAMLLEKVPEYDEARLAGTDNYVRAGSIDAFVCRKNLLGDVSDERVITVLRKKALDAGANGLTDVSCGPGPSDELSGCVSSRACSATIIKTVPSADSDGTAHADRGGQ